MLRPAPPWRSKECGADYDRQLVHVIKAMRAAWKGHHRQRIPNDFQRYLRVDDFVAHVEGNNPLAIRSKRQCVIGLDSLFSQDESRSIVC